MGLLGLSPQKVDDDIAQATGAWEGLKITVTLTIQNKRGLPSLWAAVLLATTLRASQMASAVVLQNAPLVKNYKGKYLKVIWQQQKLQEKEKHHSKMKQFKM